MKRLLFAIAPAAVASIIAAAIGACSSDDRPGAVGGGSSSGIIPVGGGDAGRDSTVADAAPDVNEGDPCAYDGGLEGPVTRELPYPGSLPPPLGGDVPPGLYELAELQLYADAGPISEDDGGGGLGPTGNVAQKTLIFRTATYTLVEAEASADAGVGPATISGGTFSKSGTNITFTRTCPQGAPATVLPYSAAGGQVGLYRGPRIELYQVKKPP
jgi:hypothetical protein